MPVRILHVSDLHFGTHEDTAVERAVGRLLAEVEPELVVASGDLTHRGLRSQHEKASGFLRGLDLPLVTIPTLVVCGGKDVRDWVPCKGKS